MDCFLCIYWLNLQAFPRGIAGVAAVYKTTTSLSVYLFSLRHGAKLLARLNRQPASISPEDFVHGGEQY